MMVLTGLDGQPSASQTIVYLEGGRCCQAILLPLEMVTLQSQTWKKRQTVTIQVTIGFDL